MGQVSFRLKRVNITQSDPTILCQIFYATLNNICSWSSVIHQTIPSCRPPRRPFISLATESLTNHRASREEVGSSQVLRAVAVQIGLQR